MAKFKILWKTIMKLNSFQVNSNHLSALLFVFNLNCNFRNTKVLQRLLSGSMQLKNHLKHIHTRILSLKIRCDKPFANMYGKSLWFSLKERSWFAVQGIGGIREGGGGNILFPKSEKIDAEKWCYFLMLYQNTKLLENRINLV